ncbi:lipid IV(A) 3-deoxy-D-manno-octulosonic acid transferase [Methylococcus sp. EFPC2]|uniref:lipid IV(A) 3-deoxy-D-manno-octulosonic acid transferase n=1 Tax=Methylococcus sp. EFPC2 TaxID=2812648 RepID=UPI001967D1E8|nr:lipid IV(A) 3-deoxy-D-manno-octulosonic acid transferase [Methylococcus sp. EFPC2]QSA97548.1 lipid IV(A) 3-deoxy-D-manno-octulosonic acid transferase [Methylococcus sp. EFPC2]
MRLVYSALFYSFTPFILGRLAWRGRRLPEYRERWAERFGFYAGPARQGSIWLHAVSVGEAEAAFPLIRELQKRYPDRRVLVTTTTPTGSARVRTVLGDSVDHVYLPYDMPDAVGRFFDHFRPALAVVMETEIWPNLYHGCAERKIPLAIANACLSERSARGYARLPALTRPSLHAVRLIAAQTEADAARFLSLGARPESVIVTGNLKYDMELPADLATRGAALRAELFGARPVLIAASTHDGEEAQVLSAFAQLRARFPDLLLVLVPRHPERFDPVHALAVAAGYSVTRRNEHLPAFDADIFLLDTLGELRLFYAAADVTFVGGSLVAVGGHNLLEPATLGVPVLFGPHTNEIWEIATALLEAGGAVQVADAGELAAQAERWLADDASHRQAGEQARAAAESGRGALDRTVALLVELLDTA